MMFNISAYYFGVRYLLWIISIIVNLLSNIIYSQGVDTIIVRSSDARGFLAYGQNDSIRNYIKNNLGKYFIFLDDRGKKSEEARWNGRNFFRRYKQYYSDGLTVKKEGIYTDEDDSIYLPYQPIGKWKYYKDDGALEKIVDINGNELKKKCKPQRTDTVKIHKSDLTKYYYGISLLQNRGIYYINNIVVSKDAYNFYNKKVDSVSYILECNTGKYFVFLNDSNITIEEGRWYIEFFSGPYKSYYPNGKIKEEGIYTAPNDSLYYDGEKQGQWKYYNPNGKLKKVVTHHPLKKGM